MKNFSFFLFTSIFFLGCSPETGSNNDDNNVTGTNNVSTNNNSNTVNTTNIDNTNNVATNNTTGTNNTSTNNTTSETCDPQDCESWEYCGVTECVLSPGRCYDSQDCTGDQLCTSQHYCETPEVLSCNFTYNTDFPAAVSGIYKNVIPEEKLGIIQSDIWDFSKIPSGDGSIIYPEPLPDFYYKKLTESEEPRWIVMPGYSDNMPLFSRGSAWSGERCYETPVGAEMLTESEAFDLYREIVEETLGVQMTVTANFRNVVGIRGAYPGTFSWHKNNPDYFNDTIVLMWIDSTGTKHVREFPINTDTGDNNYASGSTSSLLPNRKYRYQNGVHREYNALTIFEYNWGWVYNTADDSNANGHWDNDRNGWISGGGADYIRTGSGHNIHMGSVSAPLGTARVGAWSAGCQVIPGMANWTEFINNAWTGSGNLVHYYLIDSRDIAREVWGLSCTPDGSHDCPWKINSLPFSHSASTGLSSHSYFDVYGCSTANESGPEYVYEVKISSYGTLSVSVDCPDGADIDIHLLVMDDPDACLTRGHTDFTFDVAPGRYLIVADSWVNSSGVEQSGSYTLNVSFTAD
ncbi:MAG: hypothetical protein JXR95_14605 [Deltaproteobacteria bacterium]|nr:hypothetical protein [Deltaproteobacteria bacterium]